MLVNHQQTAVNHNENNKNQVSYFLYCCCFFLTHSFLLSLRHIATAIILWRYRWSRVNNFQVKYLCIIIYISFYSFISVHTILYIFCTYLYNNIIYYYAVLLFYKGASLPTEQRDIIPPTSAPYLLVNIT